MQVGGVKVKYSLAVPLFLRSLVIGSDLHKMCVHFEKGGFKASIEDFKNVVPQAMSAEDWFRFHGKSVTERLIILFRVFTIEYSCKRMFKANDVRACLVGSFDRRKLSGLLTVFTVSCRYANGEPIVKA
jgi:hypothetical protein